MKRFTPKTAYAGKADNAKTASCVVRKTRGCRRINRLAGKEEEDARGYISVRRPKHRAMVWASVKMAFVKKEKICNEKEQQDEKTALSSDDVPCSNVIRRKCTPAGTAELTDGITVLREGATNVTYNIGEGRVIALVGSADEQNPVVFKDCTFNLSGKTMSPGRVDGLTYAVGKTYAKLLIGGNIRFENCAFVSENGVRSSAGGNDACMYIGSGNIVFDGSEIKGTDYMGQFFGLFYDANVTLNNSTIATTGNTGGWSYAMYGASVLNLNGSTMTATGMKRLEGGGNVNAFYSGDLRANYDAINIKDSVVNFSDNYGGGFAINRVNIHVDNSTITVNDNAGNATNSGVWYVKDSEITMSGNRTHGFSHIGDEMENTTLTIGHNGYAGYYITDDASYQNCIVNIRCNGERYLSYSAGDVWLNGHTMTFTDCDSVWLGGVGRKGTVVSSNCGSFVAYDLYENKLKSNTESVLTGVELSAQDAHTLFLNRRRCG